MDANDRIIYERDSGKLYFDIDGKGGEARVEFASMAAYVAINHKSFDVIHDWTRDTDWL
jgi:hypothetical protein